MVPRRERYAPIWVERVVTLALAVVLLGFVAVVTVHAVGDGMHIRDVKLVFGAIALSCVAVLCVPELFLRRIPGQGRHKRLHPSRGQRHTRSEKD